MAESRQVRRETGRPATRHFFIRLVAVLVASLMMLGLAACGGENSAGGSQGAQSTPGSDLQISLTTDPNPPKSGPATIEVEVKDATGKPVEGAQVSISINHVGMSHGGIAGDLVAQGSGRYQASGSFSMSGTWRAEVRVTPQGGTATTQSFDLQVGR